MSSTHLLHSLSLLLLPLRCRRNCHQIVSLAIVLLSALSARAPEDQGGRQEREAEEEDERQADRRESVQGEEEDTPYIVANPHPILTSSSTTSSARATGTGAALTSWQSSHSHRSPGAHDRDRCQEQEQDQKQQHLFYPSKPHLQLTYTAPSTSSRGANTTPTTNQSRSSRIQISSCSTSPAHCSWTAGAIVASLASIAT